MLALFLDESGDHSLSRIDPQYPVFVLAGVIVELSYHDGCMTQALKDFKNRFCGRDDVILHTSDIVRCRAAFQTLTDESVRTRFFCELNELIAQLDFSVVACVIRKDRHFSKYGLAAADPYMLSLHVLVERFVYEISRRSKEPGIIVAESRDETLNNQLRLAWIDLRTSGTQFVSASLLRQHIGELHIRDKRENIAGLQVADLVVSPIGRHIIGKRPRHDWDIVRSKFRRNREGKYAGFGLVVLPK